MGVFLWKLILIKNAIAVDSSFPRFGIHFASKCVCCSSPCIERVDHLSQSDIARIDNRVSFLSQSQCGLILESSSLHHLLASWFNGAKSKSQGGNKAADCLAAYGHTHSDSILFNSLGSLPFDSKKPVHSQGINSESETIVLCRVREEIEHGILTGRSAKPGSLSVVRKEAPMIEKGKTISKWKCLKLLLDRNERDSELADPYTQMADIEKMVLPTSQPKKIDPGILEEGRKYLPTNRVEWAGAGRVLSVLQGPKKNDSPIEKIPGENWEVDSLQKMGLHWLGLVRAFPKPFRRSLSPVSTGVDPQKEKEYPEYITAIKKGSTELKPFIVSDLETIIVNNIHKPYAAGLMMVHPGKMIEKDMIIHTYYSEDYKVILDSFEERSRKVMIDLISMIERLVKQEKKAKTVYFHNFSRFDGIFLLKHLACHHPKYKIKPLMRNNRLYELSVYPGCVDHESVNEKSLEIEKELDIESKITLSSLALNIFRLRYYNDEIFPIHIPNQNEDTFIRKAYYRGHTDSYNPYGENLYYYYVNSLYPFVMKEYPIPCGKPVWYSNIEDMDIDRMLGFIEAYVVCLKTIKKPFLPYHSKTGTLIFPTCKFIRVYYSEELKYAVGLGYKVVPISGYLFERKESPFKDFVSSLFSSRLEARKEGNDALSYVYKILMNSLYGRFGINPKSTITENKFIVSYHTNTGNDRTYCNPPKNFAVQLAAVITTSARIYIYPYISRDDCYYIDRDSVVLSQPLPEELISSSILGMLKLEDQIVKGFFLAPKAYSYYTLEGSTVKKYKGPAKDKVTTKWFKKQYAEPSRRVQVKVDAKFKIDWESLDIKNQEIFSLGLKEGFKRLPIYDSNKIWVDTEPIAIHDLSNIDYISRKVISSLSNRVLHLENERLNKKLEERNREIDKLKSQIEVQTWVTNQTLVEKKTNMKTKTDEEKTNTDVKNKD
ncbi:DNA polymerase-like protein [Tanacetum coccineum]|uniref:DNA-directed DNA polymerase n=1 Tax=Tanacetum coccineum TaxID=301880 RepID=A0ABQ5ICF3_9ASTR